MTCVMRFSRAVLPQISARLHASVMKRLRSKAKFRRRHDVVDVALGSPSAADVAMVGSDNALSELGFLMWALTHMGAPIVVAQLMWRMYTANLTFRKEIDFMEVFAGRKAVTRAMRSQGLIAVSFEVRDNPVLEDYLSDIGFLHALTLMLNLKPVSGFLAAPVCSSFVPINAGTGRTPGRPLGFTHVPGVARGNKMAARLVLQLMVLSALGIFWVMEQPKGSMLQALPRFQQLARLTGIWRHYIRMWDFGSQHVKGTWLYSNYKFIQKIDQYMLRREDAEPIPLATTTFGRRGTKRFSGNRLLKASQEYPQHFGDSLARLLLDNRDVVEAHVADVRSKVEGLAKRGDHRELLAAVLAQFPEGKQGWADAELEGVFRLLI